MALASTTDYAEILGVTLEEGAETTQIERLLDIASSTLLASAHGQTITQATTDETLSPSGGVIRFPQRPVTDVSSVTYDNEVLSEGDDYRWTEGGNGLPAYLIRRSGGRDAYWADDVTVTYTHGYATVPNQIVAAVVYMALALKQLGDDGGAPVISRTESIDDAQEAVRYAQALGVEVPGYVRSLLDDLFGLHPATSVPVVRDR